MIMRMPGPRAYYERGRRALVDGRAMLREYRSRQAAQPAPVVDPPPVRASPETDLFTSGRHELAEETYRRRLRAHPHLDDYDSRLCELVEYFGFDVGQKAPFCRPWLYWDDPRRPRYVNDRLGLDELVFGILHMYALFNRMDPERRDMYWIFDGLVRGLERLGGPSNVSVMDFGCGLGQNGLAFASAGYQTVMLDVVPEYLDFVRFLAELRGLEPVLVQAPKEEEFYDSRTDGRDYGLIIEWSTFEHVPDAIGALDRIVGGLVPGGLFVTTTFCREWTPEDVEHYRRDSADDDIADQYLSGAADAWLRERFDVLSPEASIAKVLVRRA